jgi:hypothetical protein
VGLAQNLEDAGVDFFAVLQNLIVPESENTKATTFEMVGTAQLVLVRRSMLAAVDFDNETMRKTDEVDDVSIDRLLTPELESLQLPASEQSPQRSLRIRHVAPEAACDLGTHDKS